MCQIERKHLNGRLAIALAIQKTGIRSSSARGLAHKLILETIRSQNLVDYIVNSVLKPDSISSLTSLQRAFLRLYTYELKIRGDDNYNKAVNIAKTGRAILGWRRLRKVEEALGYILGFKMETIFKGLSDEETVSLQTFQPLWFVKYCFKLLGRSESLRFLNSLLSTTPTYIRINTLRMPEDSLLEEIREDGITLKKTEGLKHTFNVVNSRQPLPKTSSYRSGLFHIQDKASCLAVEVASPKPRMIVLDLCAAPGTKTSHMAQMMNNQGQIFSIDYSRRRMKVWKEESARMNVECVTPLISDLFHPPPLRNLEANLVLLDPPCTSTGVFGRTPSAKWRLSKKSLKRSAGIQWKMINNCTELLGSNGQLVYSTCSITIEENEALIERFLKWHPEFKLVDTKPRIGISGMRGQSLCQRLYPHIHDCNGFFVAKLQKIS
jgi:16S rRNA (cytosine967-C5)-methyltransferase